MAKDRKPAEVERDRRNIARLYLKGEIQVDIAAQLGISQATVSRDIKFIQNEWQTERVYDINEAKQRELAKIDNLELEYWQAWRRSCENKQIVNRKGLLGAEDPKTKKRTMIGNIEVTERNEGQAGDARFLDGVMDCIKQRCAILGVEAPKRTELTGKDGAELMPEQMSPSEILARADALRKQVKNGANND